jgi:membrane protein insertase Oxa1/YidC/SpoIIIJ
VAQDGRYGFVVASALNAAGGKTVPEGMEAHLGDAQNSQQAATASTGKFMTWFFPIFSLMICFGYSSAFALYWVAGNVVSIVQTVLINKMLDRKEKTAAAVAGEGTVK